MSSGMQRATEKDPAIGNKKKGVSSCCLKLLFLSSNDVPERVILLCCYYG
jgi:hypothetical protein